MCLKMRGRIERKNMMLMVKLMSKYLAIKRPAECVCQHADKQYEHDGVDMAALVHGAQIVYPYKGCCQYCFCRYFRHGGRERRLLA